MAKWIDYSGLRPDPLLVKASGATGVLRYLSEPIPATAWKRITVAEKNVILAAGLDLVLNWEWYEGRMLEGASAGAHDGAEALKQAAALGYPKGATIYFSHDTSAVDDVAVLAYMRAAQKALGSVYHADIYGGFHTVELCITAGVARYGWQTLAWSNGRVGHAHLYQNGKSWFSGQADENVQRYSPLGSWRETLAQPVVPPPPKPVPTPPKPVPTPPKPVPVPPKPVPRPVPKPTPPPAPVPPRTSRYLVRSGDSLTSVAQKFHTTVSELLRLNPTLRAHRNLIQIGIMLYVPALPVPTPAPHVTRYRVVHGDTLSVIAKRYHTTVRQLLTWNKGLITNVNIIHVGWVIRVG